MVEERKASERRAGVTDYNGYASRRQRTYDDDQSQDEDDDYVQSEVPDMAYVNTQG
jgi:hypothetical protein